MQKLTKICSIIMVVLVAVPILLLVITTPFQKVILQLFNCPEEYLGTVPVFPWISVLFLFLRLGCVLPLVITAGKRGNIVLEIILILCMMLVLPGINDLITTLQNVIISRFGVANIAVNAYVNAYIVNPCTKIAGYGQALAYVVCGMRIASKLLHKKYENQLTDI